MVSDAISLAAKGPAAVHANARLTFLGRRLLVLRVRQQGRPIAHVARTTNRAAPGDEVEAQVLQARLDEQAGPEVIAALTGVAARTNTRVLGLIPPAEKEALYYRHHPGPEAGEAT